MRTISVSIEDGTRTGQGNKQGKGRRMGDGNLASGIGYFELCGIRTMDGGKVQRMSEMLASCLQQSAVALKELCGAGHDF